MIYKLFLYRIVNHVVGHVSWYVLYHDSVCRDNPISGPVLTYGHVDHLEETSSNL